MASEQGKCISQLREVFDSCDENRSGYLGLDGLKSLCRHLQLTEQADVLIQKLLKGDDDAEVDFEDFKEGFISLLTQSSVSDDEIDSDDEQSAVQSASEREVSPKFVLGEKKYGRRSRPASIVESSMSVDKQDTDTFGSNVNQDHARPALLKSYSEPSNSYSETCNSAQSSPEHLSRVLSRTPSCHSQLDQEGIQWNSPEEFLRALWKRLQVGKDGYLNQDELACVCNNIGMETTPETIRQLFEKLDTNHDGSVTFDELLQGLFQHEGPNSSKSEMSFTTSPVNHRIYKGGSQEDMQMCEPRTESTIFTSIDLDNEGYVSASSVADLWESLGFSSGVVILQDLGFNVKLKINLHDLTLLLEEELTSACSDPVYQVALLTLQNELHFIRTSMLQIRAERNKLKCGLLEANNRAALLAQEIDEHHAKLEESSHQQIINLEKRYQEQLRDLQEELRKEREALTNQIAGLKQELEEQMEEMQDLEANFKRQLSLNEIENTRLESELQDVVVKCSELENRNILLQKELDSVAEVRQKLEELESSRGHGDVSDSMTLELEELRKENKDLQDHTEQLTIEIEQLKQLLSSSGHSSSKRHNRINSWLADYNKGLCEMPNGSGLKRRGSASSSDGNSEEENRMVGKIRRRLSVSSGKDEINMESYEPDDDQGIILDVGRASLRMNQDHLNSSQSSSSLQKYSEPILNPYEEMTKQLTEDLNIKSQIIAEKDAVIAQLKKDFQSYLSKQGMNFEKPRGKLPGPKKSELTITIQDLQKLIRGVVQSSTASHAWLQKTIDERFTKIRQLIELDGPIEKTESECRLGEPKCRRLVPETEPFPSPTDKLLKDLYVENARLVKELQLAEQQQRRAEQSNGRMQYKCKVLTKLLAEITTYTTKQLAPI